MVSTNRQYGFPKKAWTVLTGHDNLRFICELKCDTINPNTNKAVYHGYPVLPTKSDFYKKILKEWDKRTALANNI